MANSSYQENNVSSKRRKSFDNETGIDRISELPDVLIQHILSFLPTKEAMVTSILSKRWFWLWTSVPILHLEDSPFSAADGRLRADFVNLVARVLMLNKVASLDKFCLRFNSVYHPYNVRCWFWAMVARDVKEVDITTHPMENSPVFKLPCALFTAKSLTILKLNRGMELHVPGTVSLPSLKVLHLVWIKLTDDESASRLFSGCPVLQELLLQEIHGDNALNLNISIPSLKRLSLMFFAGYIQKLKMNAPILEYLILKDNQVSLEYDVEDVSSLLEAQVTVSSLANTHLSLVRALYNAKFLSFNWDWYSIKTLYNFKMYPLFLNLVRLELNIGYGGWSELSRFLESSHNLEVLVLVKGANCRGLGIECHWKPPKRVPKCFLSCLKVVHFRGFEGLTYQMSIVRYILNNARVLKMMDICSSGTSDMPLVSKFNILKKLSMSPRASKACQLQFN